MREIKMKFWDTKDHKWLKAGSSILGTIFYWKTNQEVSLIDDRFKPVFYTGLKDKYGKEIYEEDILTSNQYPFQDDGKYNYHGVVEWGDEYGAFFLTKRLVNSEKRGISHGISETLMDYDMASFEVIGNIYEKPDLLEGHSHVPSV
jgi:uncharacterized phage protein (TIGR01671 family)